MFVSITAHLIESGRSVNGGWNRAQLTVLGIAWPPQKGWKQQAIGRRITQEQAEQFARLARTVDPVP